MSTLSNPTFWLAVGLIGQGLFTARFVVQWLASERSGAVVVPIAFWWLSLAGAGVLLAYAVARRDPVFALGQSLGVFVYVRNLMIGSRRGGPRGASSPAIPSPHFRAAESAEPVAARA